MRCCCQKSLSVADDTPFGRLTCVCFFEARRIFRVAALPVKERWGRMTEKSNGNDGKFFVNQCFVLLLIRHMSFFLFVFFVIYIFDLIVFVCV